MARAVSPLPGVYVEEVPPSNPLALSLTSTLALTLTLTLPGVYVEEVPPKLDSNPKPNSNSTTLTLTLP